MTAAQSAGAASREDVAWHAIDWRAAHATVRRLQARIVQATQAGRWGKVAALQRLLTHSHSGKALAVRRVTENRGKRTPGVDGDVWDTPEKKVAAMHRLRRHGYRPAPLRRVSIPKKNGTKRPLSIPTMTDRAMQALYLLALAPVAEVTGDQHSYGFRTGRSVADAIQGCAAALARRVSPQWVLEGDIKACFDRIDHGWLLTYVPLDKGLLRAWLTAGYMERGAFHRMDEGTPQGGVISPVLANLALDGLAARLRAHFPRQKWVAGRGVVSPYQVNLIRYADDFIITGSSRELLEQEVCPLVEAFLRERGLELSAEKTVITHIDEGFDFLGKHIRKYRGKLRITPAKASVQALLGTVRGIIKKMATAPADRLIATLNPIIRGWAVYHRHTASTRVFRSVDHHIHQAVWNWARRRHTRKGRRWVKAKYFPAQGTRAWVFTGRYRARDGTSQALFLYKAGSLPIRRHVQIKGEANPYDPGWASYFERRRGAQMADRLIGRRQLLALWKRQRGICPICSQSIDEETGWHSHHVTPRSEGGSDEMTNLHLLHPTCHQQLHHPAGTVVASRRANRRMRRLEPGVSKGASPVLRGDGHGNMVVLPD